MASIIKNQILKHLSRFVKDLSSDRINVSTLKGEGELTDLKLDEEVLTELLALPIWMKVKKAQCNRARIMIQWTKLKSIPIRLVLDTVDIQIEACEELRPVVPTPSGHLNLPSAGKYGFVNKVVDGITVTVESVDIRFFSQAFESKVQISRIRVESRSPQWKKVELSQTRLKDTDKGELLTFKEIEWQTLRLEAQSTKEKHLAPLRLLTNQAKARVVIKKKLIDCSVVGCRLSLILDDLLWVLTDSQILAAAHFMTSLSGLVKQATEMSQTVKAARKLESLPEYQAQQLQTEQLLQSNLSRIFDAFDVKETSYHLVCEKIDLHFCDDPGGGRSNHPDLRDGGAGQVQLTQLMVDFYPYHLAKADRRHWFKYSSTDLSHWLKESLTAFRYQMTQVLFPKSTSGSNSNNVHGTGTTNISSERKSSAVNPESIVGTRLNEQLSKLMSTCLIVKIRDICIYKVTTTSREVPLPFLSSYLDRPKDISAINMEFTWFYYPGGICFPLPSPKMYIQIHPLQIHLDVCTILWLNSFFTNLQSCIPNPNAVEDHDPDYVDVRVDIIMPKAVYEEKKHYPVYKECPDALQIQAARIVISNYRSSETGTRAQLAEALTDIEKKNPELSESSHGFQKVPEKFLLHSRGQDNVREHRPVTGSSYHDVVPHLTSDMLWTESRDIWFISIDAVWADFCVEPKHKCENGVESKRKFRSSTVTSQSEAQLLPFVDSLPISLWVYCKDELLDKEFSMGKRKDIQAILRTDRVCNIQLTHQQYLFLLRAADAISEISLFLTIDTRKTYIVSRRDDSVELVGCVPSLEISFILPFPEILDLPRENSSILGDMESAITTPLLLDVGHKIQGSRSSNDWDIPQRKSPGFDSSPFLPESPDQYYPESSMDSLKSTFAQGMKQGISSLVVSFSKGGGLNTPDSEVTSMWSTDSSENNFTHLDPDNDLPSPLRQEQEASEDNVEVAEEVGEDFSQSTGSFSIHNPYGKEDDAKINILTACLNGLELSQHSEGLESQIGVCCHDLLVTESMQIAWKEFQANFATRSKRWRAENNPDTHKTEDYISSSAIKINFSQSIDEKTFLEYLASEDISDTLKNAKNSTCPRVNLIDRPEPDSPMRKAINQSTHPVLKAVVDLRNQSGHKFVTLHSSTLKSAAEFFENDMPPVILPMNIFVRGANLEIIEDKTPGLIPVKVSLQDTIVVRRDSDGVFQIGCSSDTKETAAFGTDKLCNGKDRKSELVETEVLKRTIQDLKQQVLELEKDKTYLLNQLQPDQKQRQIVKRS